MSKVNRLSVPEVVQLRDEIVSRLNEEGWEPYEDWDQCIAHISSAMDRKITRNNVEGLCKQFHLDVGDLVQIRRRDSTQVTQQMEDRITSLESTVDAIKSMLNEVMDLLRKTQDRQHRMLGLSELADPEDEESLV